VSFPAPNLAVPALTVGQVSYGGLIMGGILPGGLYNAVSIEGLNPPDVLAGDAQRAQDEGEFIGLDVYPGRDIVLVQNISATTAGYKPTTAELKELAEGRMELAGVLGVKGKEETPLWIETEAGEFAAMVRPRKHHYVWDSNVFLAGAVVATTSFHATDPRFYLAPSNQALVGLPSSSTGLEFPTAFPAVFSGSGLLGLLEVTNAGKFEMRPVLLIYGPCTNPRVTNLSIEGNPYVQVNISMNTGDTLTIDMDFQTVTYRASGSEGTSSRRNALAAGCTWWNLPPPSEEPETRFHLGSPFNGTSQIAFSTGDVSYVTGTLTVQSASAYVGL
jgi:hypothetical protein